MVNAQISEDEYNKLNSNQKSIYSKQKSEIEKKYESDVFRAEDRIKMGNEMKMDGAKFAGSYYTIKGMNEKDKAEKERKEAMDRLDKAAREGIKNNEHTK
jgi:hypothetical protein